MYQLTKGSLLSRTVNLSPAATVTPGENVKVTNLGALPDPGTETTVLPTCVPPVPSPRNRVAVMLRSDER
jgi:hypothetical protein